jgi:Skp family chaperone for outer membrane proteins
MGCQTIRILTGLVIAGCVATHGAMMLGQSAGSRPAGTSTTAAQADDRERVTSEMQELRAMIEELRQENQTSRAEMRQLREELQKTQCLLEKLTAGNAEQAAAPPAATGQSNPQLEERVEKLEESGALLSEKVNEQHQTKVEAASKYGVRLSGIVLMNAFRNHGTANNFDYPDFAQPGPGVTQSGFGATMRQSEIGLEIFGPNLAGARTSANIHLDFAGGFPATPNAVDFGIVRLKTASMRFDWEHTSVVAGQDSLFISPLSPTSFASLATPAFAYAGNLWGWTPQLRIEHHFDFSNGQKFTVQAGILDNLTWDFPSDSLYRAPGAGEQSGQPAYAVRTAWSHPAHGRELSFGAAGYFAREDWNWDRYVDGWAGMGDWQVPLATRLTLSGEFYRGRGAGGLGAGIGRAVLYGSFSPWPVAPIRGVDSAGGWSQLSWEITPKIELNGVVAQDDAFSGDVRGFAVEDQNNYGVILGRNRGALGNVIFRPRSDLILAAEFRRLRTYPIYSDSSVTNQLNLAVGVLF